MVQSARSAEPGLILKRETWGTHRLRRAFDRKGKSKNNHGVARAHEKGPHRLMRPSIDDDSEEAERVDLLAGVGLVALALMRMRLFFL